METAKCQELVKQYFHNIFLIKYIIL